MKKYLEIGKIVSVQGLKGEVRVEAWCDSLDFLCEFDTLYFDKGEKAINIVYARPQKNVVIMKIEGIDTVEMAQTMRNKILYMDRDDVILEDGCYFIQDLIGLEVFDFDNGTSFGEIVEVTATGANDVYHIKGKDEKIRLVPAIPDVVIETDITNGRMSIRVLEGLFDED